VILFFKSQDVAVIKSARKEKRFNTNNPEASLVVVVFNSMLLKNPDETHFLLGVFRQ
jgi:hypothetical protein